MYAFDVATALEGVPLMLRPPVRTAAPPQPLVFIHVASIAGSCTQCMRPTSQHGRQKSLSCRVFECHSNAGKPVAGKCRPHFIPLGMNESLHAQPELWLSLSCSWRRARAAGERAGGAAAGG